MTSEISQLRKDIERVKSTLDDLRQIQSTLDQMSNGVDKTQDFHLELAHTITKLGDTLDSLVQDLAEVRLEQQQQRAAHTVLAQTVAESQKNYPKWRLQLAPVWAAVAAAVAAVWATIAS